MVKHALNGKCFQINDQIYKYISMIYKSNTGLNVNHLNEARMLLFHLIF